MIIECRSNKDERMVVPQFLLQSCETLLSLCCCTLLYFLPAVIMLIICRVVESTLESFDWLEMLRCSSLMGWSEFCPVGNGIKVPLPAKKSTEEILIISPLLFWPFPGIFQEVILHIMWTFYSMSENGKGLSSSGKQTFSFYGNSPVIKALMKKKLRYYVKRWKTKMKKDYSVILQSTHYTMGANKLDILYHSKILGKVNKLFPLIVGML